MIPCFHMDETFDFTCATDPCYAAFHDQEWGVPVHDDRYALSRIKSARVRTLTNKLIFKLQFSVLNPQETV
jgi:hypothetical protein